MFGNAQRRTIFIKTGFQLKLIFSTFFFFCGGCFLFLLALALLATDSSPLTSQLPDDSTIAPLLLVKHYLAGNWILFAIGGIVLIISSIILSHRVAGPLYRFEHTLDLMNQGDLQATIKLRDKDEGKPLAEKINEFNATLSKSVRIVNHSTDALDALLDQVDGMTLPEEKKEELASVCWAMREHNRKMKAAIHTYTPR